MKEVLYFFCGLCFCIRAEAASSGICAQTAEACSYTLDDNGKLTITGNGAMSLNTGYYPPWGTHIKEIDISGITSISTHAFVVSDIKSIEIPDSVDYLGDYAFEGTYELASINLPSSLKHLSAGVFSGTSVHELILPDSLFDEDSFFSELALTGSKINNLVCSAEKQSACMQYLENAKEYYWPDDIPPEERTWPPLKRPLSNAEKIKVLTYSFDDEGHIVFQNKVYSSFHDLTTGNYIKKRIYTIEEASKIKEQKNTFKIRYK